jgi:hypothetical protein
VQRHRLFAAGIAVALVLGAATPALAKPGKGHAHGHRNKPVKAAKPAKPAKEPKAPKSTARVNGGGVSFNGVEFSVQAKAGKLRRAHFNYTSADGAIKIRCKSFETMSPVVYIQPGPPAMHVTADCVAKGPANAATPVDLDATFVDNGETGDEAHITVTRADGTVMVSDTGAIQPGGNINVRY